MAVFKPFSNEKDTLSLGELTVENRFDRLEIYGSLQITRDKAGLALAKELEALARSVTAALQAEALPEHIVCKTTDKIDNPFKN